MKDYQEIADDRTEVMGNSRRGSGIGKKKREIKNSECLEPKRL